MFGATAGTFGLARVALGEPPADARSAPIAVRPHELDPMGHVNNAVYADWLEEAVIAAGDPGATRSIPRFMRLEYAGPADPAARLSADVWPDEAGWSYRLRDAEDHELLRARLEAAPPQRER